MLSYQRLSGFSNFHFEIAGDPFNLIGSQQCDLFTNHTITSVLNRVIYVLNHVAPSHLALYRIISVSNTNEMKKPFCFRFSTGYLICPQAGPSL